MALSMFKPGGAEQRALSLLDAASPGASLRDVFKGCDDETWLWALTEGRERDARLTDRLPELPDEQFQKQFTGRANRDTFEQAVAAVSLFLAEARSLGLDTDRDNLRVIDVGCGWGRITQTLFRDAEPANIVGCDVMPQAIELCRGTGIGCELVQTPYMPPAPLRDESADLIVAYSVFSHLSEPAHIAWVEEFARLLRPGGVLVVTTRNRGFIRFTETVRRMPEIPAHARGTAASFVDVAAWEARYDSGEFCFDGMTRDGETCPDNYYGEAVVSEGYATREWGRFLEKVRFTPAERHARFDQSIIAARKPG